MFQPVIIYYPVVIPSPGIHNCPSDDPIIDHFPAEIKELVQKVPKLLLAGHLAKECGDYYRDDYHLRREGYKQEDILDFSHAALFQFVVCHDELTDTQGLELINNQIVPFLETPQKRFNQIQNEIVYYRQIEGKKNGLTINITFLYGGTNAFFRNLEFRKKYLIDIGGNRIVFESEAARRELFGIVDDEAREEQKTEKNTLALEQPKAQISPNEIANTQNTEPEFQQPTVTQHKHIDLRTDDNMQNDIIST